MIHDLARGDTDVDVKAPVCIIGAGTAGLFLAQLLRRHGLEVVLLEAGGRSAQPPESLDQVCEQRGIRYRGADLGRSFGLGGTSVLWGGQMLPLTPDDMAERPEAGFGAWPVPYEEIAAYFPVVRETLNLGRLATEREADVIHQRFSLLNSLSPDFELRLSTWLPFGKRNFAKCFARLIDMDVGISVWLNAAVVGLNPVAEGKRLESIVAQSPNGRRLKVRARAYVICAGALESTRLLLAHDEATEGSITAAGAPLGKNFADHLSITCGRFACRDWSHVNLAVGPIFQGGLMRTSRLELAAATQKARGLPSAFAHFTFVTHGDTGFDVVRKVLRRRQGERQRLDLTPGRLWRAAQDVSAMGLWRLAYRRLWIPRQADLLLQVDIEQAPNPESCLTLINERDALGRKRLAIDWRIGAEDIRVIREVADLTLKAWYRSDLREAADLELTMPERFDSFDTLYDVYHPTGTLRMGSTAATSVVDRNLRLWAAENCYVSSTAVFPSAGSANPGFTHLALTARLAEHLSRELGRA